MQIRILAAVLLLASPVIAQTPDDPFPRPIEKTEGVVRVNFTEFATIPDFEGEPARIMTLVDEPGTRRLFVSDMRGPLYSVSYDGETVTRYMDINDDRWGVAVESSGRERGIQSFAFHPQFSQVGAPGYGKFYTWTDTENVTPQPDFRPGGGNRTHDTVLLEWTAQNPAAERYDGGAPREIMRFEQPFGNHNGGHIAFKPGISPDDPDYGLLYMGVADGGSGGDPLNVSQNLANGFGKVFRIDPLGANSANGEYGIPASNRWAGDGDSSTLGEIYAYGVRNPQRFNWDSTNGNLFLADVGQNIVEELSLVPSGANLGWNDWEGSYRFISRREVGLTDARNDPSVIYPVAEYGQLDPLLQSGSAASGVHVYRSSEIPQLANLVLWGDMPTGEIFYLDADDLPEGGQDPIRRVLLNDGGEAKTLLQLIQGKNRAQGRDPAGRTDMRMGSDSEGRVYILNKYDGVVRRLAP